MDLRERVAAAQGEHAFSPEPFRGWVCSCGWTGDTKNDLALHLADAALAAVREHVEARMTCARREAYRAWTKPTVRESAIPGVWRSALAALRALGLSRDTETGEG